MSNPVLDQVKAFVNFEENDIGEMPPEQLSTFAAQDAMNALLRNWEAAMGDGEPLGKMMAGDIDAVIGALQEIKRDLVSGLGERLDETHPRSSGPSI